MKTMIRIKTKKAKAENVIEKCCKSKGLTMALKSSLAKYPGSVHWHFKRTFQKSSIKTERGTLEITFWKNRVWFPMRKNRSSKWVKEIIPKIKIQIERKLRD